MPIKLVLDTNVCLDLFVFRDPRAAALNSALTEGGAIALSRTDCRDEWLRVLVSPQLKLDRATQALADAAWGAVTRMHSPDAGAETPLPRCADADDQKFLRLARDAGASMLISRDRQLLVLSRRTQRMASFSVLQPQDFPSVLPR